MKKILKIILANILIFITLLFIIEIFVWGIENYNIEKKRINFTNESPIKFHKKVSYFDADFKYFPTPENGWGRAVEGLNYKKEPIVIFGCSFAYGFELENKDTFSYLLSHSTKRPVFNRAFTGWGIQHMLYQVRNPLFFEQVKEPEYAIFVMIDDHFRRLYLDNFSQVQLLLNDHNLRYKEVNNKLVEIQDYRDTSAIGKIKKFINNLYIVEEIKLHHINKKMFKNMECEEYFAFALKHFLESRIEMQKHWKKTKYVVILYDDYGHFGNFEQILKDNNFIVINTSNYLDSSNKKYKLKDNMHPNALAWEILTPKVIEALDL